VGSGRVEWGSKSVDGSWGVGVFGVYGEEGLVVAGGYVLSLLGGLSITNIELTNLVKLNEWPDAVGELA
jgi:hypothetical protein